MANLVFGMNLSLGGHVHHEAFALAPYLRLRLVASDRIGEDVIRLTYVSG